MPTPAIQTLLTDAQQVLNLNSLSEVRATMAAALANANVGTPLNPNLTTQQLWDEFYLIVRQPESDIESIITNQLMKFLYAPPAPGGVGADGQVIFNDGGVLAGDPQFLWNKTTNLLTVTGSATITGDLTVDTSTLKVDSTNDRVGIGTATPEQTFNLKRSNTSTALLVSSTGPTLRIQNTSSTDNNYSGIEFFNASNLFGASINCQYTNQTTNTNDLVFVTRNSSFGAQVRYRIAADGVATWAEVGGVAGTAMTLNSTGLGIGDAPTANCKLTVKGGSFFDRGASGGSSQLLLSLAASSGSNFGQISNTGTRWALGFGSTLTTVGTEALVWDSSGNVGIGVTPSAWNSNYNGLDIGQNGCIAGRVGSSNTIDIISNGFRNSAGNYVYKLATSNTACRYQLDGSTGSHIWYSGAAGTAGNTIAGFSTALMTLDASGNLILQSPSSPPTLGTNGQLTVNATSNTNLRFSYRGSDGTTRVANITLA